MRYYVMAIAAVLTSVSGHIQSSIRSGDIPARGVNLGGWLVAENWINPHDELWSWWENSNSVKSQGEYYVMEYLGQDKGQKLFTSHHKTYITEADIAQIAFLKFNMVRVPVGYWIRGCDDDYITQFPKLQAQCNVFPKGGWHYLDKLVREWGPKYNVAILVDVHGVPGSQNGMDHSGQACTATWSTRPENVLLTQHFVRYVVDQFKDEPAFLGVDMMNEPSNFVFCGEGGINFEVLRTYYEAIVNDVRNVSDCILISSPLLSEQAPGTGLRMGDWGKKYKNIWHQWHPYLAFSKTPNFVADGTLTSQYRQSSLEWTGNPLFFGEWSLSTPTTVQNPKEFYDQYIEMLGTAKGGWAAWTWKASQGSWSMQQTLGGSSLATVSDRFYFPIYSANEKSLQMSSSHGERLVNALSWIDQMGRIAEWSYEGATRLLRNGIGSCFGASGSSYSNYIYPTSCSTKNSNMAWHLINHTIVHEKSKLCLTGGSSGLITLETCNGSNSDQYFNIGREEASLVSVGAGLPIVVSNNTLSLRSEGSTTWIVDHERLTIDYRGQCIQASLQGNMSNVSLSQCIDGLPSQRWRYDALTMQFRHTGLGGYCLELQANSPALALGVCANLGSIDSARRAQQFNLQWIKYPDLELVGTARLAYSSSILLSLTPLCLVAVTMFWII